MHAPLDGYSKLDRDREQDVEIGRLGEYVPPIGTEDVALLRSDAVEERKESSNREYPSGMFGGMFSHELTWADAAPEDAIVHVIGIFHLFAPAMNGTIVFIFVGV